MKNFKKTIRAGIPSKLPVRKDRNPNISHAPKRKDILSKNETAWPCVFKLLSG